MFLTHFWVSESRINITVYLNLSQIAVSVKDNRVGTLIRPVFFITRDTKFVFLFTCHLSPTW